MMLLTVLCLLFIFQLCSRLSESFRIASLQSTIKNYDVINNNGNLRNCRQKFIIYAKKKKNLILDEIDDIKQSNNNLNSNEEEPETSVNSDESNEVYRAKLKAEIAAPFFRLRLFFYVAMIVGGGIGTIFALPQFIASLQQGGDVFQTALQNLVIDVGACGSGVALWIFDSKKQEEKVVLYTEKELKLSNKISSTEADERSKSLSALPVEIQSSEFNVNDTKIVSLGDLQSRGSQNVVIFAGVKSIVKDAILSARIEGSDLFVNNDLMLIPLVLKDFEQFDTATKGFGKQDDLLSAPYFAKPTQLNVWQFYLAKEVDLAIKQGEPNIVDKGLVLLLKKDGKVIRRGVGLPPWKKLIEEFRDTKVTA